MSMQLLVSGGRSPSSGASPAGRYSDSAAFRIVAPSSPVLSR